MPTSPAPENQPAQAARLKSAASTGARWSLLSAAVVQASTMVSTLVAARLLEPAEFAIVAATTVVANLYGIIGQAGFGASALVGKRDDDDAASTFFWAAFGVGSAIFALAAITAPLAAVAIGQPEATATIRGSAFAIPFLMGITVVQFMFFRRLRYSVAYSSDMVTAVVTSAGPVLLLLAGWGAWGVVLPRIVAAVLALATLIIVGRWVPRPHFEMALIRANSRFGAKYFGTRIASYLQTNMDYWIVGNVVSTAAFGAYYVAFVLPNIIRQRTTQTASSVVTPLLVKLRDDPAEMRLLYERVLRAAGALAIPALVGLGITADLTVRIAFGPGWEAAVFPLRIMAVMAAIDVASQLANSVFLALEQAGQLLRRLIVQIICLGIALLPVFYFRTINAAAWASLVGAISGAVFTQRALAKSIGQSTRRVLLVLAPIVAGTLAMTAAVVASRPLIEPLPILLEMLAAVAIGGVAYLGFLRLVLPRSFRAIVGDAKLIFRR